MIGGVDIASAAEAAEPRHGSGPRRTREERLAALEGIRGLVPEGSLTSQYISERQALKDLFPGTFADLERDGIIKLWNPAIKQSNTPVGEREPER